MAEDAELIDEVPGFLDVAHMHNRFWSLGIGIGTHNLFTSTRMD
ncbi:hypothetical protein KIPB_004501, partial [Kipferlia bialata]|eukprot:g4501.t1